jgi:hypothetical protein
MGIIRDLETRLAAYEGMMADRLAAMKRPLEIPAEPR